MADHSTIEWTDATWNPIVGCDILSPGCTNCYAMGMAARIEAMSAGLGKPTHYAGTTRRVKGKAVWTGRLALAPEKILTKPLRWKTPRMIFVNSTSDLFHEKVPDEVIDRVFAVMALCPQHIFQVLTKRPKRMREYLSAENSRAVLYGWLAGNASQPYFNGGFDVRPNHVAAVMDRLYKGGWPLPNVWLGVSAEDQARADERIPDLLATPAAIRFVSAEPLLGPIDFNRISLGTSAATFFNDPTIDKVEFTVSALRGAKSIHWLPVDWIIVGGESGPRARPMHPDWARSIRDQCAAAGVPFFFKQWGSWWPQECNPLEHQRFAERLRIAGIKPSTDNPPRGCWGADGKWHPGQIAGAPPAYTSWKIGKKAAGRLLDGVEHNGMPEIREVPAL